jgi:hydroxypyruvate reductase
MNKPHVLIMGPMMPSLMQDLELSYTAHRWWEASDGKTFLQEIGPSIQAVTTTGARGASKGLIEALPNLQMIACYGVGVDAIDLETAWSRNIQVTNTPDVLTDDVADMAIALLLAASRRMPKFLPR